MREGQRGGDGDWVGKGASLPGQPYAALQVAGQQAAQERGQSGRPPSCQIQPAVGRKVGLVVGVGGCRAEQGPKVGLVAGLDRLCSIMQQ